MGHVGDAIFFHDERVRIQKEIFFPLAEAAISAAREKNPAAVESAIVDIMMKVAEIHLYHKRGKESTAENLIWMTACIDNFRPQGLGVYWIRGVEGWFVFAYNTIESGPYSSSHLIGKEIS